MLTTAENVSDEKFGIERTTTQLKEGQVKVFFFFNLNSSRVNLNFTTKLKINANFELIGQFESFGS